MMALFIIGAVVLVLGMALVLLKAINKFDDVYNRFPHDKDLQELFKQHMLRAQKMEEELTRWVLGEVDPDHLGKVHGLSEQEALDTAMCLCCLFGLGNAVAFLIDQGARIDAPLNDAAAAIIYNLARKRGIVVKEADLQGSTALHMCALCGHPELTELLCKLGTDPSCKNRHGSRPFVLLAPCTASNCVCISNKIWSFGCRTARTRRVLRSALARQLLSGLQFLFPANFDSFFGFGPSPHLKHDLLGAVAPFLESHEAEVRGWLSKSDDPTPPEKQQSSWLGTIALAISGISALVALLMGIMFGDETEDYNRHVTYSGMTSGIISGQILLLSGLVAALLYIFLHLLSRPSETSNDSGSTLATEMHHVNPTSSNAPTIIEPHKPELAPSSSPSPPQTSSKANAEKERDKRKEELEHQWLEADKKYEDGKFEEALKIYTEIAGGVTRWLDQDKFRTARQRQRDCALGIAEMHSRAGERVKAVHWYCSTLAEHADSMSREAIVGIRYSRDRNILEHLRVCSDAQSCADLHASLNHLSELQRPGCVDAQTWAAWKKKDKTVLAQILEARMEQVRDTNTCKNGSPTLLAGFGKYESALKACDKANAGKFPAMDDAVDFMIEILLWMAEACTVIACNGHSDACISACKKAMDHVDSAMKLLPTYGIKHVRKDQCSDMKSRLETKLQEQMQEQEREAAEAQEVERVLAEQRKLEEEARLQRKKEQDERQRKAREERQRKEQERRVQLAQEKEEAIKKKAEEAAAKKKEAEDRRKREEEKAIQEEAQRVKREEEERIKAEAAERALAQAIAENKARKEAEEQQKAKELQKQKERELQKEKEKEIKAQKEQAKRGGKPGQTPSEKDDKKKETPDAKKPDAKTLEKEERQKITQLVADKNHEEAVHAISRLMANHGSRMSKQELSKLVDRQRLSILQCVRQGSSHSFGLNLPAALSDHRDYRKDPIDQVLVMLALGETDDALNLCEKATSDVSVGQTNLKAEALVMIASKLEDEQRLHQASQVLIKAGKVEPGRKKLLEPKISALQAKAHSNGTKKEFGSSKANGNGKNQSLQTPPKHVPTSGPAPASATTSPATSVGITEQGRPMPGVAPGPRKGAHGPFGLPDSQGMDSPSALMPIPQDNGPMHNLDNANHFMVQPPQNAFMHPDSSMSAAGSSLNQPGMGGVPHSSPMQNMQGQNSGFASPGYLQIPQQVNGSGSLLQGNGPMGGMMGFSDEMGQSMPGGMGNSGFGPMLGGMPHPGSALEPLRDDGQMIIIPPSIDSMNQDGMGPGGGMGPGSLSQDGPSLGGMNGSDPVFFNGLNQGPATGGGIGMLGNGFGHSPNSFLMSGLGPIESQNQDSLASDALGTMGTKTVRHKRSESADHGLDEILAMPWLGDDDNSLPSAPSSELGLRALSPGRALQMSAGPDWSSHSDPQW